MVYVVLAPGFEDIEAVTCIDMLRRGNVEVVTVGVGSTAILSAHGIYMKADTIVDTVRPTIGDYVIIPGGMGGVEACEASKELSVMLLRAAQVGAKLCAICAGPRVLCKLGLLDGYKITCYPGMESEMTGAIADSCDAVVHDRNRITGRAPGTSLSFAYAILEAIKGERVADKVKRAMVCAF